MATKDVSNPDTTVSLATAQMPDLNFKHIIELTDLTGIIQHAVFATPNRKEGYCIDDNSRALLLTVWACKNSRNQLAAELMLVYLSFIHYMQTRDGYFQNFLTYNKKKPEIRGSEDSYGRTLMALGFLINDGTSPLQVKTGEEIFAKAYPHVNSLTSLRGIANSIVGICQFIKYHFPDDLKRNMVISLADKMTGMYKENKNDGWHWFEPILTYDNAMLPLALLNAYEITMHEEYLSIAFESMQFLESKVFSNNIFRPVGNQGWCKKGCPAAQFDQQPIDAMAMILYYQQAFRITREPKYLNLMYSSYRWFLGDNDLGKSLYDPSTGGCADGLHSDGINLNQGAESTLAFWISHMVVTAALSE